MSLDRQAPGERKVMLRDPGLCRQDLLHVAVIVEDLRLPLDEGAKKTVFSLISAFIRRGARVSIFTRYENLSLDNRFILPGNKLLFGFPFARSLVALEPDVLLYIPSSSGTFGAFLRAASLRIQSSGRPLALLNLQYRKLPRMAPRLGLRRFIDIAFTQSQASADELRSIGCQVVLLPGGVDSTVFQPVSQPAKRLLRQRYGFQDTDRIVLHIGHGNRNRNGITLARLVGSGFKAVLVASTSTAVDWDYLDELKQAGVTVITDYLAHIQHYYQMADCYLFPVWNAGSAIDAPLSVLEAMSCNLPVVTTRFGALPGLFETGNGFYFGDTEEEILGLVNQAVAAPDCQTAAMVSPYTWDSLAATILEALEGTVSR